MLTLAHWIAFAFVVIAVISCSIYFFRYRGTQGWPTVIGTVEALVRIKSMTGRASDPLYGTVSYSYAVGDEYYSGEWDTPLFPSKRKVVEFVEKYMPPKSAVVVQHNRKHPERSTLQVDPQLGQPDYLTELKI